MLRIWIITIFFIFGSTQHPALAADIWYSAPRSGSLASVDGEQACLFWIDGPIQPGDAAKFRLLVLKAADQDGCKRFLEIHLNSTGGSLNEALNIAVMVNTLGMYTKAPSAQADTTNYRAQARIPVERRRRGCSVEKDGKWIDRIADPSVDATQCVCASACVFIWAAGIQRTGDVVALHRPYSRGEGFKRMSPSEAKAHLDDLGRVARVALSEFAIPEAIISRMLATGSDSATYLTDEEIFNLQWQAHIAELVIARCGQLPATTRKVLHERLLDRSIVSAKDLSRIFDPINMEAVRCYNILHREVTAGAINKIRLMTY